MKHFTKEEQKKYTESIRKVFNLPEEYLRRADEKLPSDSKELKKDYLKLRSENTLLGERCNQLLTDKGKLTDRVQELEAENSIVWTMIKEKDKQIGEFEKLPRKVKELEAQIEKMSETLLDLLWFEGNLDPYMYECNEAQKGELLKPFTNAREYLKDYICKKCKGEGIVRVGYNGWDKNPCPACKGKGYIFRR